MEGESLDQGLAYFLSAATYRGFVQSFTKESAAHDLKL
jgi:hypothetical protein